MNVATRYKIISKIINSKDEEVLNQIKDLLNIEDEEDFWDALNAEDQNTINEGIDQLDKGQHVAHQSIQEEIKKRFKF